ncbi:ribosome maturation factor RimP [Citricoccus sp. GCM10030269]|uniref:ribosome maturation factor RimP n=1 Tax=Citricoccus sp. GCM10030269 TaxID=3273388 RepID=UPI00361B8A3E
MPAEQHPHSTTGSAGSAGLAGLVAPAVESTGLYCEAVTVGGEPGERVLTVIVDRTEGTEGLDLDEIAAVTQAVSTALDAADDDLPELGTEPYQLEVSSPGVSRPLTEPRHWRRNVGRLVTVEVEPGTESAAVVTGRIESVDEDGVVLVPVRPGAKKGMPAKVGAPERHAYDRLGPAQVQVELTRGGIVASGEELNSEV